MLPDDIAKAAGAEYGERLNRVLGASPDLVFGLIEKHRISCEALRNGTLQCAHSPNGFAYLKQRREQWGRRGAPVEILNRKLAAEKIGSNVFHGALLDRRAGTIQPLAYAHGLAQAAIAAGAKLFGKSPVTEVQRDKDLWRLGTPFGSVWARAVIVATNAYLDGILPQLKKTMIPFNYFQFSTEPLPEEALPTILPERNGAWDTQMVLSSYRLDQCGRLIVGSVGQVKGWAYGLHREWARRTIDKVFPQARGVRLEHGWYGVIAMTADHIPRFHILGPDLFMVTGYNGRGIGPGTVFGKLLAGLASGAPTADMPLPVSEPRSIRLWKLRDLFYETGARMNHLFQRRI
jgi:sarcosine oxidase